MTRPVNVTLPRLPPPPPEARHDPDEWRALIRDALRRRDDERAALEATRGLLSPALIPVLLWIGRLHFALGCAWAGESAFSDALSLLELHEPEGPQVEAVRAVLRHRSALEALAAPRPRRTRGPRLLRCIRHPGEEDGASGPCAGCPDQGR